MISKLAVVDDHEACHHVAAACIISQIGLFAMIQCLHFTAETVSSAQQDAIA